MYRLRFQHNILKHPFTQTILIRIAKAGFVVKINFFTPGLQFQADLSIAHLSAPACAYPHTGASHRQAGMPAGGIFKGRFQSDNQHRLCNHPRRAMRTHHR